MGNKEHDHIWVYVPDFSCKDDNDFKGYWINVESVMIFFYYHWEVLQMSVFL